MAPKKKSLFDRLSEIPSFFNEELPRLKAEDEKTKQKREKLASSAKQGKAIDRTKLEIKILEAIRDLSAEIDSRGGGHPATAEDIATRAGCSVSKVYEVIKKIDSANNT